MQLQLNALVTAFPAPALVAKNATRTVPVIAVGADNPVDMGLAATMARPGGNVTGISSWAGELAAKRLQVVRDLVPTARRSGIGNGVAFRLVHSAHREDVLGEIDANVQNAHGLPLPNELMRLRTAHRSTQLPFSARRLVRDGEVPSIR